MPFEVSEAAFGALLLRYRGLWYGVSFHFLYCLFFQWSDPNRTEEGTREDTACSDEKIALGLERKTTIDEFSHNSISIIYPA
jgi:hypothetical protein